jgi:hypothetical protein
MQDYHAVPTPVLQRVRRKPVPSSVPYGEYQEVHTEVRNEGAAREAENEPAQQKESKKAHSEESWPRGPQRLRRWTTMRYLMLAWDIVLTLIPVVFLGRSCGWLRTASCFQCPRPAYGNLYRKLLLTYLCTVFSICALALNNKELSGFGENIREGTKFGPTIFPIVFAAIVARLIRAIALKCAERGATLGVRPISCRVFCSSWY